MKNKSLAILIGITLILACVGYETTYQDTTGQTKNVSNDFAKGYFTVISEWGNATSRTYKIVYANDTKVKYFVFKSGYYAGITPLYNEDGSLQVYDGH